MKISPAFPNDLAENSSRIDLGDKKLVFQPSARSRLYARLASPPVLATLLILAFGAGLLVANLLIPPVRTPAPLNSHAPSPLNPLTPTPLHPSPAPPPTPTATAPDAEDTLETLYVEIAPADMAQIEAKREKALQLGILLATGGDYVPAAIHVGPSGGEVPVELRLKGDWTDHFAYSKWSFRVRALDENYVFGMRTFSLQDPSTRAFLNEWAFLQNLRSEGVLAVRYRFVRVVLNGEYKGIYALEEGFSKELFEAQEHREGLIIRYDEDLVWEYRAFYDDQLVPRGVNEFYIIDEFQSGRVNADPALSAQRDVAVGLLRALWTGEQSGAQVFDLETMGRFLALSDLWRARHALVWHNLRYYYNPVTARLEPVAFDCHPLASTRPAEGIGLPQDAFYRDPYLQAAYVQELERITQPGYVERLEAQLGPEFDALYAALEPEFGPEVLARPWDILRLRQELIRQVLDPYQTVYTYVQRGEWRMANDEWRMAIDVGNLLDLPVEIVGFEVDGTMLLAHNEWVRPESSDLVVPPLPEGFDALRPRSRQALVLRPLDPQATYMPYVHLQIPRPATFPTDTGLLSLDVPEINIVTRLWGLTTTHTQTVLPGYALPLAQGPLPTRPTVEQALAQHPYLQLVDGQDTLRIAGGTWDVNKNLILPAGFGLR
ncbi:MAG: CotH kinase family protein, partial [Anaerolineae bacterium]